MNVYLVRHAQALGRHHWPEADERRPLSGKGGRQAQAVAALLAGEKIARIASSPATRCRQTVEPLAEALDLEIESVPLLNEGASAKKTVAFMEDAASTSPGDVVLCSHGDVIPDVLSHLRTHGMKLHDDLRWSKGSTWALTWDGQGFTEGRYLPPSE